MRLKQVIIKIGLVVMMPLVHAEVSVNNEHITAKFDNLTLEQALTEIADATGIEVWASQPLEQKLLIDFKDVPLEKVLNRILAGHNATYLRNPETGKIEQVRLFSVGDAPVFVQEMPASSPTDNVTQNEDGQFYLTIDINGTPVKALVDTGASVLAISSKLAGQLGLSGTEGILVDTAAGQDMAYRSVVDRVSMAGKDLHNVQALILPDLSEPALIGQNILAHYRQVTEDGVMRFEPLGEPGNEAEPLLIEPVQQ